MIYFKLSGIFGRHGRPIGILLALALLGPWLAGAGQGAEATNDLKEIKDPEAKLHFQEGEIALRGGLAKLQLPQGFRYLAPDDTDTVLVKFWGNPPGSKTLGMIVPPKMSLLKPGGWAIIISYQEDGYVKDSDADKIDYTKLLKEMQEAAVEANKERRKEGYSEVELIGWAAPPRYERETHKMYWAKELKFSGSKHHTLNYGIRVLGRTGVLVLNAVASMDLYPEIEKQTPEIVKMVEFNSGHRYADFDSKSDKVAAYGLAALVAGGIAAKAGFFKLLLAGLLAAKKFVVIGIVALGAFIKKLFARKNGPDY